MADLRVSFPKPCGEDWEAMAQAGCGRTCARCDKVVHHLSRYDMDGVEALLRADPDACVRAQIGADGAVELKPGRGAGARRLVVAAAVSASLLTTGEPALAKEGRPAGAIAGQVEECGFKVRITATHESGRTYSAKAGLNGRYKIKHLPAGTYNLAFHSEAGDDWKVDNVAVGREKVIVPARQDPQQCIVIGLLRVESDDAGRA